MIGFGSEELIGWRSGYLSIYSRVGGWFEY